MMNDNAQELELPGFRFHPTEEELLDFYLKNMIYSKKPRVEVIGLLNIYRHDPWELPGLSRIGEREWYFFVPRDRKQGTGGRPSRMTEKGYWKATGSDRRIISLSEPKRVIGLRKTLVFYQGRAPRGSKTDWIMNEYRLPDGFPLPKDIVLCKIYRKATSLRALEQQAVREDLKVKMAQRYPTSPLSSSEIVSFYGLQELRASLPIRQSHQEITVMEESEKISMFKEYTYDVKNEDIDALNDSKVSVTSLPELFENLPELQVTKAGAEWNRDSLWGLSPCLQNLTPIANILNF